MPDIQYHLAELEIARDPNRPEHCLPDLSLCRVGVADVGCGIGQLFVAVGDDVLPGLPRYGFDIDPVAIDYANQHWPDKGQFSVASGERLPLPDRSVDLYVSRVSFPYMNIRAAVAEAARVLVPGGRLWITLHPISMALHQIGNAVRKGRVKDFIGGTIFLCNGAVFHAFGTSLRILGIRESWQSEARMRHELRGAFRDIRVTSNSGRFVIEATRR
ncbi:MAG TPA: class I SAM-dependent methyltransferase [Gemmatimonadaceae bacterium]